MYQVSFPSLANALMLPLEIFTESDSKSASR